MVSSDVVTQRNEALFQARRSRRVGGSNRRQQAREAHSNKTHVASARLSTKMLQPRYERRWNVDVSNESSARLHARLPIGCARFIRQVSCRPRRRHALRIRTRQRRCSCAPVRHCIEKS